MTKITPINQGESLPFEFDRGALSIVGWICTLVVKEFPADDPFIIGVVEPTNGVWQGFLTSTQTRGLPSGKTYRLYAILTDGSTDEEEQVGPRFSVSADWAA